MKKRKFLILASSTAMVGFGLSNCSQNSAAPVILTVSTSPATQAAMEEINQLYHQANPHVTLTLNVASSTDTKKQIEQGIPIDVIVSFSAKVMDGLQEQGLLVADTRRSVAKDRVALLVPKGTTGISDFKDLVSDRIKTVSLGDPEKLTVGKYAEEVLNHFGILEQVKPKAAYATTNSSEVLRAVATNAVDAGITFTGSAQGSEEVVIAAIAPDESHSPLVNMAAVAKTSQSIDAAKAYVEFLSSEQAASTFEKHGFARI